MEKKLLGIAILFVTVVSVLAGDPNVPTCLCEEPTLLGRKVIVSQETKDKIEEAVQAITDRDEISGRGFSIFGGHPAFKECGKYECRTVTSEDSRCYNFFPFHHFPSECPVSVSACEPTFGYTTSNELRIIVQAPKAGFRQCVWQHKCRAYGSNFCQRTGRCTQQRSVVRLVTYDLEKGVFFCENVRTCCGCPCRS